jgi:hypothetical protein
MAQVQALARAGDGHVHQAALFLQAALVAGGVLVREQAFFQPADEHRIELQPLAGVHRHQLHGVLAGLGLVVAGLQRRVRQEGGQRRQGLAGVGVGAAQRHVQHGQPGVQALAGRALRQRGAAGCARPGQGHGIAPKPSWVTKLSAALTSSFRFSMRSGLPSRCGSVDQAAGFQHALDDLAQALALGLSRSTSIRPRRPAAWCPPRRPRR